jgi:hypothetical protein
MRKRFEARQNRLQSIGFSFRKIAWRQSGNFVCRHGVFFARPQAGKCPCMAGPFDPGSTQWRYARHMTVIDDDLKDLVWAPFKGEEVRRLGQLQAELRRRNYT